MLNHIAAGRTDLAFDHLNAGHPPDPTNADGASLSDWCACDDGAGLAANRLGRPRPLGPTDPRP